MVSSLSYILFQSTQQQIRRLVTPSISLTGGENKKPTQIKTAMHTLESRIYTLEHRDQRPNCMCSCIRPCPGTTALGESIIPKLNAASDY